MRAGNQDRPGPAGLSETDDRPTTDDRLTYGLTGQLARPAGPSGVGEVACAGEDHRQGELVGPGDRLFVADRAARLDDRGRAGLEGTIESIGEREEGVAGERAALGPALGFLAGDLAGVAAVLL